MLEAVDLTEASILQDHRENRALPVCLAPWLENPYRLVSLLDIVKVFDAFDVAGLLTRLEASNSTYLFLKSEGHGGRELRESQVSEHVKLFDEIIKTCEGNEFKGCFDRAQEAKLRLEFGSMDVSTLVAQLEHVRFALLLDLRNRRFFGVPKWGSQSGGAMRFNRCA